MSCPHTTGGGECANCAEIMLAPSVYRAERDTLRDEVERLRATMRGGIDFWQTAEAEATQRAEVMTALVRELADVLASSPHFTAESPGDWEEQARAALARVGEMLGEEKKP